MTQHFYLLDTLVIHIKAKAWVFPYKFWNYFVDRGFANGAKSWIQLRTNTVHYHFVFLSPGSCFKSEICLQLESAPIVLFSQRLKEGKIIHQKDLRALLTLIFHSEITYTSIYVFPFYVKCQRSYFSVTGMKTRAWRFVDLPGNATCLLEEAHWLARTITNCPRAEQILLNRLAKNITYCVLTIYMTWHDMVQPTVKRP